MTTLKVSSAHQITIPKRMRESLRICPGDKLHAIEYRSRIVLIPVGTILAARGCLGGIDTRVPRDP